MERIFICLANSRKYSGRCVAGVELSPSGVRTVRYHICTDNGRPRWIRPVSSIEQGQVSENLVGYINLLDIVDFQMIAEVPDGFQVENIQFDNNGFNVRESIPIQARFLDKLVTPEEFLLFGNRSNLVSVADVQRLSYSLVFIRPPCWKFTSEEVYGRQNFRVVFTHENLEYNLPITDIQFCERFILEPSFTQAIKVVYLTISLGREFKGSHYKLVAGVICLE